MIYPDKFINKVLCGDCLEVMKEIPDNSVDFVLTSPPYDKIRDYHGFDLDLNTLGRELFRIIKDGGVICVVIQDGTQNFRKSGTSFRLAVDWMDIGFGLFETVIYNRDGRPGGWWSKRFRVDHEYIFMFFKGERPKTFNKTHLYVPAKHAGKVWGGTQRLSNGNLVPITSGSVQAKTKCRGTIWKYEASKSEHNKIKMQHPATFPDKLASDLIKCFTLEGDIVLDPLSGSGTVGVIAKKEHRKYILIDISQEYIQIAQERMRNELE